MIRFGVSPVINALSFVLIVAICFVTIILRKSVKSFASVTDDIINIFTVKSDDSTIFIFFGSNFYFAQVHVFQYFFKICLCGFKGSNLIKCPDFCGASGQQSKYGL